MAETEKIKMDFLDPGIAQLTMQDEEGKNSFSSDFVKLLIHNIRLLCANSELKVILLAGLPSVFCSGADLATLRDLSSGQTKPVDIILPKIFLDVPIPVIAAMEGHAIGGGLALGLCADIVLLAEESRYGCSFMNMGFTPGMGMTRLLENFMSPAIAHEMQYTGIAQKGRDLKGKTNFNYILPKHEVFPQALQLAQAIAEKPRNSLTILKRYLGLQKRKIFEETYAIESMMHELTFGGDILQYIEENYVGE